MTALLVGLGGATGALLRYGLNLGVGALFGAGFPWATLLANVLGSFALGMLMELGEGRSMFGVDARIPLGVGVLGGFTTYSSFNLEVIRLAEQGLGARAVGYATATVAICGVSGLVGVMLGRSMTAR